MVTLQNLLEMHPTILDDNIVLPDGLSKDTMKSVIMMRLGLCWPVYDDPKVFSNMLYTWFMAHAWNIERLKKVTETTYEPLENYDRQEDFTDTGSGAKVGSDTNNNTRDLTDTNHNTRDLTDTNHNTRDLTDTIDNDTTGSGNSFTTTGGTNTNSVAAYNSTTFQNDNKTETSGTNQVYTSSDGTLDETKRTAGYIDDDKRTAGYIDDNKRTAGYIKDERNIREETSNSGRHAGRAHGNIGVTTTQEMFNQELQLLSGYNLYYTICNWIEKDLFIQVY